MCNKQCQEKVTKLVLMLFWLFEWCVSIQQTADIFAAPRINSHFRMQLITSEVNLCKYQKSETAFMFNRVCKRKGKDKRDPFSTVLKKGCLLPASTADTGTWQISSLPLSFLLFYLIFLPCSALKDYPVSYPSMQGRVDLHIEKGRHPLF